MTSIRTWVKSKLDNVEELKKYFECNPLDKGSRKYFSESYYIQGSDKWNYGLLDEAAFNKNRDSFIYLISLGFKVSSDLAINYKEQLMIELEERINKKDN